MAFRDDKNSDTQEETGLVRYGEEPPMQPKPSQPRPFVSALIWCGFGAVALTSIAVIGVAMVAYGTSRGISAKLSRSYLGALAAASVAGLVLGWLWVQGNLGVVLQGGVDLCVALVVGGLAAKKRANLTVDYAAAALATLATIGLNWLVMSLAGEDFFAAVRSIIDTQVQAISKASGLEMAAQIRSVIWVIYLLWPFAYFVAAGLSVLAAHFAGWVARETPGTPPSSRCSHLGNGGAYRQHCPHGLQLLVWALEPGGRHRGRQRPYGSALRLPFGGLRSPYVVASEVSGRVPHKVPGDPSGTAARGIVLCRQHPGRRRFLCELSPPRPWRAKGICRLMDHKSFRRPLSAGRSKE